MKKVLSIIVFLLCALSASALSYASPYKSTGRTGMYMTVSSHHRVSSSFARTPSYTMNSVNSVSSSVSRGAANNNFANTPQVRCMYTYASAICGGVTTSQTCSRVGARKGPALPDPELPDCGCYWYWDEEKGQFVCPNCDCELDPDMIGIADACDCDPCHCPIGDGWQVWLFMIAMAAAYGFVVKRRVKKDLL